MLEDLISERKKKLDRYKESHDPYPAAVSRTHKIKEALGEFDTSEKEGVKVSIVGRLISIRGQGKIIFGTVRDESGEMQVVWKADETKEFKEVDKVLDSGDIVGVTGTLFVTARGEKSVQTEEYQLLAKSVRPWPSTWYGIEDIEARYRNRYLDLHLNPEVKAMFESKSRFWNEIRAFLLEHSFTEVEMNVLESVPGGAEAEPFMTHHNALDANFYLRISLELPLKKLLVGGFERVFEMGRIFRNEGIDRDHLQDYTQMEFYLAYADYTEGMGLVENMYKRVVKKTIGGLETSYQGEKINWGKSWKKVEYSDIFKKHAGIDPAESSESDLIKKANKLGITSEDNLGKGRLIDLIFKKTTRPSLIDPCFLINPPVTIEPLAKRLKGDRNRVARYQILAAGTELGKGFSELNDPFDQRERFEEQMRLREKGDKEAQMIDEEYIEAMEYGMPPNTGFGMSERVFSVLMDKPIRECVFFPLMRNEKNK